MSAIQLLDLLTRYLPLDAADAARAARLRSFVETDPRCFERSNPPGHITGSAWIVDPSGLKVLLVHHKKLGKWLQPGGHADGDTDILRVATREAHEETGLLNLSPVTSHIFDVDIHLIPAHGFDPEHEHFDIRFAFQSSTHELIASEESNEIAWVQLERLSDFSQEESLLRMARKWEKISLPG